MYSKTPFMRTCPFFHRNVLTVEQFFIYARYSKMVFKFNEREFIQSESDENLEVLVRTVVFEKYVRNFGEL